jgi:hypothetical protein
MVTRAISIDGTCEPVYVTHSFPTEASRDSSKKRLAAFAVQVVDEYTTSRQ